MIELSGFILDIKTILSSFPIFLLPIAFIIRILATRGTIQSFDSHGHLYFAKELKAQKQGAFGSIRLKVFEGSDFSAPFFWHWTVGRFPEQFLKKYQWLCNSVIDSIFATFIYLFTVFIGYTIELALLTYFLYLFTPLWFSRLSWGPRINSFTPRLSCEVLTNLFFVIVCVDTNFPDWLVLIAGGALAGIILTSAKFSVQALIFLTPLISVMLLSWTPIITLAFSILTITIISKGASLNSIKQQIQHLTWYFLKNMNGEGEGSVRNKFDHQYLRIKSEKLTKYIPRLIATLILRNAFTGVFIKAPVLWVSILLLIFVQDSKAPEFVWAPVLAGSILFLLTNFPKLLFLGESERYLNHVAYFIVLWGALIAEDTHLQYVYWGVVIYGAIFLIIEIIFIPKLQKKPLILEVENKTIIDYLKSLPSAVVLCFPYHSGGGVYRLMHQTHHKTIFLFATTKKFQRKMETNYPAEYPYSDLKKLDEMHEDFGVNILIMQLSDKVRLLGDNWTPSLNWVEINLGLSLQSIYIHKTLLKAHNLNKNSK